MAMNETPPGVPLLNSATAPRHNSKGAIVQWNACGMSNKKNEILDLINKHNANIVALQETMLSNNYLLKIPKYNVIAKEGTYNNRQHGGVAMYIHGDVPYQELSLDTPIQAVAATVQLRVKVTICNIYIPPTTNTLTPNNIKTLYDQLPKPCILLGDFNAHSQRWGCNTTNQRGRTIEQLIDQTNLVMLNNGAPTRPNRINDSAIDLTMCSANISQYFEWNTTPSVLDSDHYPIAITTNSETIDATPIRLMKKANWTTYTNSAAWNDITPTHENNANMLTELYNRINEACEEAIPTITPTRFYPKPWWTPDLTRTRNIRERLYKIYRRNKTDQNRTNWSKARAEHKRNIKKAKDESWEKYTSEFNASIPISNLCKRVKRMKNIAPPSIRILNDPDQQGVQYTTPSEISEVLAKTFAGVSSDENYSADFIPKKIQAEQNMPDFGNQNAYYNKPFTVKDLNNILSKTNDTAPGEDGVTYQMIKNMPDHAKNYITDMYNKFFKDSYFPEKWKRAIIIPIPKPGKNPNSPNSYRPIALTSCLCKIFERLINERLLEYLIMNRILTTAQCGCQKGRSTIDHLIRLETAIRTAYAHKEHFISVFFDLERAYDMTWRQGIIIDLFKAGLRGLLPKYIASFLGTRYFKVKVGSAISNEYEQQNGVPQGAVLSVLLFALKINDIVKSLPRNNALMCSLYVDDLQVGLRGNDLRQIGQTLQTTLNGLHKWTMENGFKFSIAKTNIVHYTKIPGIHNLPDLRLGNELLVYKDCAKFLGLQFDKKLTWTPHLSKLKNECQKLLGIMKMISGQSFGATQACLLKIFKIYIRSKLDYGSIVYASATPTELNKLKVVTNDALRISTGAFKSTKIEALYGLSCEITPELRRDYLALRYYVKIKSNLSNPANNCITVRNEIPFTDLTGKPFSHRIQDIKRKYDLPDQLLVQPEFSYLIHNCKIPFYAQHPPMINRRLTQYPKDSTPPTVYKSAFRALIQDNFLNHQKIYTDGSKSADGVGSAAVTENRSLTASLPAAASIFSAEMHALKMAVDHVDSLKKPQNVIFTDSRSVIESLHNRTDHPTGRYIIHKMHTLRTQNISTEICWVPSHIGINGNEKADQKAKEASRRNAELIPIYYKDYFNTTRSKINTWRNEQWRSGAQMMIRQIKEDLTPWPVNPGLKRRDEVILNRLRSGYTNLTHGYLMEDNNNQPRVPPICHFCDNEIITVNHIFTQCTELENERRTAFAPNTTWNLKEMLGIYASPPKILRFLRNTQLYTLI